MLIHFWNSLVNFNLWIISPFFLKRNKYSWCLLGRIGYIILLLFNRNRILLFLKFAHNALFQIPCSNPMSLRNPHSPVRVSFCTIIKPFLSSLLCLILNSFFGDYKNLGTLGRCLSPLYLEDSSAFIHRQHKCVWKRYLIAEGNAQLWREQNLINKHFTVLIQ